MEWFDNDFFKALEMIGLVKANEDSRKMIEEQPTAYDVGKVLERIVKQLEDMRAWKEFMTYDLTAREREIINRAIEIVKASGVNESF